jgi:NADPH:quinone reductase
MHSSFIPEAARPQARAMQSVRLTEKAATIEAVAPTVERVELSPCHAGELLVEIRAAAVNPSDAKAAIGMMPYAVFPRTPGRDFSGVVVDGPRDLVGREVFGSSGDLGIRRDGTHATHLLVDRDGVVEKPAGLDLVAAAGIGVPFVTAQEGFLRTGLPQPGETVLILGINGKVGQAAAQIATWCGARVFGAVRRPEPYAGHASADMTIIDQSTTDVAAAVREATGGKGADIVFNTVGEPYHEAATRALAVKGRMIIIASFKQPVAFDLFSFYRGRHTYVGIDTLALSTAATADVLRALVPGFVSGHLRPFEVHPEALYPLERAGEAYAAVLGSTRQRIFLVPGG